nr:MAG TPA: hypothetical protein [Caudoviricetes sp.]
MLFCRIVHATIISLKNGTERTKNGHRFILNHAIENL